MAYKEPNTGMPWLHNLNDFVTDTKFDDVEEVITKRVQDYPDLVFHEVFGGCGIDYPVFSNAQAWWLFSQNMKKLIKEMGGREKIKKTVWRCPPETDENIHGAWKVYARVAFVIDR